MSSIKKQLIAPRVGQINSETRTAFIKALIKTPSHSKLTGQVFNALCSPAGIVSL